MVCLLFMNRPDLSRNASLRATPEQYEYTEHHTRPERQAASGTGARGRCSACLPFVCRWNARRKRQTVFASYTIARFSQICQKSQCRVED